MARNYTDLAMEFEYFRNKDRIIHERFRKQLANIREGH